MKMSFLQANRTPLWLVLAMVSTTVPLKAVDLLTATPSSVTLTCSTVTGPGPAANVLVKSVTPLTGSNTHVVTVGSIGEGLLVNFADQCPNCEGRGVVIDAASLE